MCHRTFAILHTDPSQVVERGSSILSALQRRAVLAALAAWCGAAAWVSKGWEPWYLRSINHCRRRDTPRAISFRGRDTHQYRAAVCLGFIFNLIADLAAASKSTLRARPIRSPSTRKKFVHFYYSITKGSITHFCSFIQFQLLWAKSKHCFPSSNLASFTHLHLFHE